MIGATYQRNDDAQSSIPPAFFHIALFTALILQKFGLVSGQSYMPFALPVFIVLIVWLSVTNRVKFHSVPLTLYLAVACLAVTVTLYSLNNGNADKISISSLILFLLIYLIFTIGPKSEGGNSRGLSIYLAYARLLAIVGILQYVAQFLGYRFVSFGALFPFLKPVLLEQFYNSNAIVAYGSDIVRSNAIFLREPSTFSQLLCISVVIEIVVRKNYKTIPLYATAYMVSFSGTGVISLVAAILLNALFSLKHAIRVPLIALGGVLAFFCLSIAAPELASRYTRRVDEVGSEKSSANARYLAQGSAWRQIIADHSILTGNGPGSFERTFTAEGIASNPVLKLTNDYGILTIALFIALLISVIWLPAYRLVSLIYLAAFQLGGGTELNPSFIIPMLVVCVWTLRSGRVAGEAPDLARSMPVMR